ncbi:MAG: hypothetical protein ABI895_19510 [Deltaproteobacteria bacterium]
MSKRESGKEAAILRAPGKKELTSVARPRPRGVELVLALVLVACGVDSRAVGLSTTPNTAGADASAEQGGTRVADAGVVEGDASLPLPESALSSTLHNLEFEPREVGTVSDSLDWVIDNSSDHASGELTLSNSNPGEFQVTRACPETLSAGASCTIGIRFLPQSGGSRAATLQLGDATDALYLQVAGTGQYRLTVTKSGSSGTVLSAGAPGIDCGSTCSATFSGTVTLYARVQNGQDSVFTGWSGAACDGLRQACVLQMDRPQTLTAGFGPMEHNLIFISSKRYPPNLGGLSAYDAECNRLASAVGINDATNSAFVAVMTDAADSANVAGPLVGRVGAARGWVRMDGLPVADEISTMFATPYYTPFLTEQGEVVKALAWTGIGRGDSMDDRCGEWTSVQETSAAGMGFAHHLNWLQQFAGLCSVTAPIYCMGKSKQVPLGSVPAVVGKRFWLSLERYVPGSRTPDELCQANRPAGVQQAVAFIAHTDRPASAVIDPAATYVMPDGRLIGSGAQIIATDMVTGPWLLSDGSTTIVAGVWTGAASADPTTPGTADTTCLNWTSNDPSRTATSGTTGYSDRNFWFGGVSAACSGDTGWATSLYCVEP